MKKAILFLLAIAFIVALPLQIKAQDNSQQNPTIVKAKVTEIVSQGTENSNPFTGPNQPIKEVPTQDIKAVILEGKDAGKIVQLTNDYDMFKVGDDFYLSENPQPDGTVQYNVNAPYMINSLVW